MTTWVLLRGLAREARHWGGFGAQLQRELPGREVVVALDLPGNGALWRERSPLRVEAMVEAARRELAHLPHRPPYVLVALSLGGMVALHWAGLERRKIQGCVLINSSLGGMSPFWHRLRPAAYPVLARILLARDAAEREARILGLTSNLPVAEMTARLWARYAQEAPVHRANALRQLTAAARFRSRIGPPPVPTLLLASEQDRLVSCACSRALGNAWDAPLALHPTAGHDLPLDDPQWVVDRILAWRRSL